MGTIYIIENIVSGKQYVGKTTGTIAKRWKSHLYYANSNVNTKLYNAIRKYGVCNFEIYPMETEIRNEVLNSREKYWIYVLNAKTIGYNMTNGGDGGFIHDQTGKHWKIKDTSKMKGVKTVTPDVVAGRLKITGKHNYQFKGYIVTPWGTFESVKEARLAAIVEKAIGNTHVVVDSISTYIKNLDAKLNPLGRRTPVSWRGKTPREIGFNLLKKETNE